jgi:hypothetical protein
VIITPTPTLLLVLPQMRCTKPDGIVCCMPSPEGTYVSSSMSREDLGRK